MNSLIPRDESIETEMAYAALIDAMALAKIAETDTSDHETVTARTESEISQLEKRFGHLLLESTYGDGADQIDLRQAS